MTGRHNLVVAVLAFVLAACGAAMTPAEIQTNGTHSFNAPMDKVFAAAKGALLTEGYEIATENPEKGVIKTKRKLVRADASMQGPGTATAVEVTRQYIVRLTSDGGRTQVTAEPKVFQGDADLSDGSVWALDGDQGERALWQRLFREIEDGL
jgi:hypothetical protein